jgi:hypothetical protein
MALGGPQLSVNLPSVDLCSLLLLVDMLLVGEELHTWLWRGGLHRDRRDGQERRDALRCRCGGDGDTQGYHVATSGVGGSGASPFTQGSIAFVDGILEGGVQRWRPTVHQPYE